ALRRKPCRRRANAAGVSTRAAVDALPAARRRSLHRVTTGAASQQSGQEPLRLLRSRRRQPTPVRMLRGLPRREIDERIVRGGVYVAAVATVVQLPEVDTIAKQVVDRFFAPRRRSL